MGMHGVDRSQTILDQIAVLSGTGNHQLDRNIMKTTSELLGVSSKLPFLHLNMGEFPDGEPDMRIEDPERVRGKHVVILQSAHSLELLEQFLTLAWSAKNEHGAKSVTGVLSFMYYRRQENPRDNEINRAKMLIDDMANNRFDHLIFCDIHSQEIVRFCREAGIDAYDTDPSVVYADHVKAHVRQAKDDNVPFFVYSPDLGSVPRAVSLARELGVSVAFNSKDRNHQGETSFDDNFDIDELNARYPDVEIVTAGENMRGARACMREDEVSTGGTANRTGGHLIETLGIEKLIFCATHAVCTPGWKRKFVDKSPFHTVYLGNTIDRGYNNSTGGRITTVDVSQVIAVRLTSILEKLLDTE